MDTQKVQSGLGEAKKGVMEIIKFAVNSVGVPIMSCVIVGFILFNLVKCVTKHRMGEDFSHNVMWVIGLVILLALVASFPSWGWKMAGV